MKGPVLAPAAPGFTFTGEVTAAQRDFYEEYGFIAYRHVFARSEVEAIRADARELESRTLKGEIPAAHCDQVLPPGEDEAGRTFLHRLPYFTRYCEHTRRLITERGLDAIGTGLIGSRTWRLDDTMGGAIWQLKMGGKGHYSVIDWHLDFPEDHPLVPVVSVGIYLDPSTINNGCLMVVPASNRYPIGRVAPSPLAVEAEPGDIFCHAYNIFHASGPIGDQQRRATLYLYYSGGNYPGPGLPFAGEEATRRIRSLFRSTDSTEEAGDER